MGGFPNSNLTSIPFPSYKGNNFFHHLQMTGHKRTKWVVDHFMGFPLRNLDFPHWLKGLNASPLFLVKSCPHLFNIAVHS